MKISPRVPNSRFSQQIAAPDAGGSRIVIGLVNNMPDAALGSTERQFRQLLFAASRGHPICVRLFSLPEVPRGETGRLHVSQYYKNINELWSSELDGLIVTGTEPAFPELADEPYWSSLTRLIDWAEDHTTSTIWSCLAAHAAVFHIDGIRRRRLPEKLSGVFECIQAVDHPILTGVPFRWHVPHSRYNDIAEHALVARNYLVLSRSLQAGVDMFARQGRSLFLLLQGHPEFDPGALRREYCRDVKRFLAGQMDQYPAVPQDLFDENVFGMLSSLCQRATRDRGADVLPSISKVVTEAPPVESWASPSLRIYENWLSYLRERGRRNAA